jgi:hypothetical protein
VNFQKIDEFYDIGIEEKFKLFFVSVLTVNFDIFFCTLVFWPLVQFQLIVEFFNARKNSLADISSYCRFTECSMFAHYFVHQTFDNESATFKDFRGMKCIKLFVNFLRTFLPFV